MIRIIHSGRRWASRRLHRHDSLGPLVDRKAKILCVGGVTVGRETWIADGATVCAGDLQPGLHRHSEPHGRVVLGDKCEIHSGAILAAYGGQLELGDNVSVNPYSVLYGHGGLSIGHNTRIAAHVSIVPANHIISRRDLPICEQGIDARGIVIEDDVWIGTGVRVLDGVRIGRGAVLAAGAVVRQDVPSYSVVGGVPARVIKSRD